MTQLEAQAGGLIIGLEQRGEKSAAHIVRLLLESRERLKSAIEYAHSEGFQWPADPMAEFADR